jgi:hypothetical protein
MVLTGHNSCCVYKRHTSPSFEGGTLHARTWNVVARQFNQDLLWNLHSYIDLNPTYIYIYRRPPKLALSLFKQNITSICYWDSTSASWSHGHSSTTFYFSNGYGYFCLKLLVLGAYVLLYFNTNWHTRIMNFLAQINLKRDLIGPPTRPYLQFDIRLTSQYKLSPTWEPRSSESFNSEQWKFLTHVSGKLIGPILTVQEFTITTTRVVIIQRNTVLTYFAAESQSHA